MEPADPGTRVSGKAWLPYVFPFGLYLAFLGVQGRLSPESVVWLYPLKTLVVAGALLAFRKSYEELRPSFSPLALVVGTLAIAIWIAIDPLYPGLSRLTGGTPPAPFDPGTISSLAARWTFIVFRVLGAVLVVPVDGGAVLAGIPDAVAREGRLQERARRHVHPVLVRRHVVLLFGAEHEQWLAGLICGALYNGLLYRTKSLTDCVVAHATSNALLAAWVLARGDWRFW